MIIIFITCSFPNSFIFIYSIRFRNIINLDMLLGVIVTGLFVAISMTAGGGAGTMLKNLLKTEIMAEKDLKHIKQLLQVIQWVILSSGPAVNPMIKNNKYCCITFISSDRPLESYFLFCILLLMLFMNDLKKLPLLISFFVSAFANL